jgi:arabinogalactan endo-1,4-beta-galactosidase
MIHPMIFIYLFLFLILNACSSAIDDPILHQAENPSGGENPTIPTNTGEFFYGADLSYVNEMEDCGAVYFDADNNQKDVYEIFADQGVNLARYRLWHNPTWTNYSNLADVKKSIRRAKDKGLYVLLDFHYSDTWADPGKQIIPAAWLSLIDDTPALAQELYDYTYEVLDELHDEGLTPDIVQVGNEINPMILQQEELVWPIDWNRNATLLNKAIKAVRDFSTDAEKTVEIMLHIAQPENGLPWFEQATNAGVADYDWIGISYYPKWSDYTLENLQTPLQSLVSDYGKKLMVVETAYPFTLDYADTKNNLFDDSSLLDGYPATQEGQFAFLTDLVSVTKSAGGAGVVYWEPAWISTSCRSAWENSTLLDFAGKPTKGMTFYNQSFSN